MSTNERTRSDRHAYWTRMVLVGLVIALGLWISKAFIAALIWALVIAIALDPMLIRIRAYRTGKGWNQFVIAMTVLTVALIVIVPLGFGVTQAALEGRQLAAWAASAKAHGVAAPPWLADVPEVGGALSRWWQAHLGSPEAATRQLDSVYGFDLLTHSRWIGGDVLHRAVIFGFTLLTLFFLLRDRDSIIEQARIAADRLIGPAGERIGRQAVLSVRGTIDGLVLVGMGEGAVMAVVYLLLGTPHPFLLGVLTGIAAMIPFGAAVIFVIAALLLLGVGSPVAAILVIVIGLIVVGIADHVIRPALIGGATRLPFLWVLIGILGGAETLGILGLFVGPATMAVIVMLWRDVVSGPEAAQT